MGSRYRFFERAQLAYPGEKLGTSPVLSDRLGVRVVMLEKPPRRVCGESVLPEREKSKTVRWSRSIECGPNAPLLIRIVKYPYAEDVVRPRRKTVFEGGLSEREARARNTPSPLPAARAAFGPITGGNPLRAFPIRHTPLRIPTVDEWLSEGAR